MSFIKSIIRIGYEGFAKHLPASSCPVVGSFCRTIRYWFARQLAIECGKYVNLERGATVAFGAGVRIGDLSGLGKGCLVEAPLTMGKNVNMAPDVVILRQNHHGYERTDIPMREQEDLRHPALVVCDDVWFGRRAMILPGCRRIGKGSIVGAGAVVTKDVPDYTIVAGNPAKEVKKRQLTHDPVGEAKLTLPSGVMDV